MDEKELLERIKENPSLFSELFKLYYKSIFGYILRRTGSFDETADIAADTFYKAFLHVKNFSYRGISIKVWLYRIATNEINLHFRKQRKRNSIFERSFGVNREKFQFFLNDDREEAEAEMQKHKQYLEVLQQLRMLPVKYQEVLSLRYFEGKSNREIAEILDIHEGTVKSILSRGLVKLREKCNQNELL
ncbi:MAG: RNA polymerase sigma factor [Bacteroidales bacterium]|nr:RNA polymerase sigma factor [Bacteroidales bacterium]